MRFLLNKSRNLLIPLAPIIDVFRTFYIEIKNTMQRKIITKTYNFYCIEEHLNGLF
jgi:hypothetical protein